MICYHNLFNWVLLLALQQINRLIVVSVWIILGSKCMICPTWNSASLSGAWWMNLTSEVNESDLRTWRWPTWSVGCTHESLTLCCSFLGRITPHRCWLPCATDVSLGGTAELVDAAEIPVSYPKSRGVGLHHVSVVLGACCGSFLLFLVTSISCVK